MLNEKIRKSINSSVLCWLATSSSDNIPNVSPKEIFMAYREDSIIIANIASPQSVKNIKENQQVCISFIDIFVQKGFQIKGIAEIVDRKNDDFENIQKCLEEMTQGKYPFESITKIKIEKVKEIIAPSYIFYPEISEENKIAEAKKTYLELAENKS